MTTEVLIAGAGPTGLMAANVLARAGINFRIVDKTPAHTPYSKAVALHAPTLETLELVGLIEEFTRLGYPAVGASLWLGSKPAKIELADIPSRYPYLLILPQSDTECILEENLKRLGYAVERNTEVGDFSITDEGVTVTLHKGDATEEVQARYLISGEGAHSPIRHKLGLPFEGKTYALNGLLGDVQVEGAVDRSRLQVYTGKRGFVFLAAFHDGYVRIIGNDLTKQGDTGDLTLADLQDTVDAIVPHKLTLKNPRWLARFGAPFRIVPTYRQGPVFLAGDAAHVHSPAGGQGMNMGLQDAYNLAWKLALVLKGQAPAGLLDTYNAERHTVDHNIMSMTDLLLQNAMRNQPAIRLAQRALLSTVSKIGPIQHFAAGRASGLAYDYAQIYKAEQGGQRLPDFDLFRPGQPVSRFYDLLREGGYVLLAYLASNGFEQQQAAVTRLFSQVQQASGGLVRPYLLLDYGLAGEENLDWPVLVDFKGQFRDELRATPNSLFLVRPDRYLAFQRQGLDWPGLETALQKWAIVR